MDALLKLCNGGDLENIRSFLFENNSTLEEVIFSGRCGPLTLLDKACMEGKVELVKLFLLHGSLINHKGKDG